MEITPQATTATTTPTINPLTTKSPERDTETLAKIQPTKSISFTNGFLKRHYPQLHHHHQLVVPPVIITYKECLKNHAAALGGHALDGCGEFMPSRTACNIDPTMIKCAACGCHRNFHRREVEDSPPPTSTTTEYKPHHRHQPPPPPPTSQSQLPHRIPNPVSSPPISSSCYPSAPHMLLALSGGHVCSFNDNANAISCARSARKRFRTKFSQTQKEKMYEFAERVGWKMQKRDDDLVKDFCYEVGVDKGVFKVWMHNNKNTSGKRDSNCDDTQSQPHHVDDDENNRSEIMNHHHQCENDSGANMGTNGSSSSS